jgi:two-component system, cell cycle sensor histidine kinase and response regulator CckA
MAEEEISSTLPMILRSVGDGDYLRVNPSFVKTLGLAPEELLSGPLLEWIHPDDSHALALVIEAGVGAANARHRGRSGDWFAFDWQVRSVANDIMVLGQRPEAVAQQSAAASSSRQGSTLSETLEAMVHIVEAKNPGLLCSILLVGPEREFSSVGAGPSLPAEYNEAVHGLRIGPTVGSCGTAAFWNVPVVVENIAEDPLWTELRSAAEIAGVAACWSHPVTALNGDMLGAMALYSLTPRAPTKSQMDGLEIAARMVGLAIERKRLEEQLRQAAKLEALGVLAGGIAHDFNNLLTTILGNAELAGMFIPKESEANEMLHEIVAASVSATELCNQMSASAGHHVLSPVAIECNGLVRELGGLLQVAVSKKATISYELDSASMGVMADRGQLRQVVMNLITNAAEAIGENEGEVVVSTNAREYSAEELGAHFPKAGLESGEYVLLQVSDTGEGMTAETQAKLFDPFFTTKATGRGLGLAAVRGILRGHAGAIALETVTGVGTTFSVLLPRVRLPEHVAVRPSESAL